MDTRLVQSAFPSCYSNWLASPRMLCVQATSKYVNIDTYKFLCNLGIYNPGSSLSQIFIYFLKTLDCPLPRFPSPLNQYCCICCGIQFPLVCFLISVLVGSVFTHYFLILLFLFLFYIFDQIGTMAWNTCLLLFTNFF